MFCFVLLCVHCNVVIIFMGKRESCLLCFVFLPGVWLFLTMTWVCLQFVIVVFPDHTHLLLMDQRLFEYLSYMRKNPPVYAHAGVSSALEGKIVVCAFIHIHTFCMRAAKSLGRQSRPSLHCLTLLYVSTNLSCACYNYFLILHTTCERLFICSLWSPARNRLCSWLSFVVSSCEFITYPLASWVRCGT